MARDEERSTRSKEVPIVDGLPDAPGIGMALRLTPGLGQNLRGLADELLVKDFPGATISRAERELLATATSADNDCFYCMDSHGAFATLLLDRAGAPHPQSTVDAVKSGGADGVSPRMRALLHISRVVARDARALTRADVTQAIEAGASDGDTQLAVLIAAAFSMFNRMVDGFRAPTPPSPDAFAARATEIVEQGYSAAPPFSLPAPGKSERPSGK